MIDNKYQEWVENEFPGKGLRPLSNSFLRNNIWFSFGKHQGKNPWVILEQDPGYFIWAWENESVRKKLPELLKGFITEFSADIMALTKAKHSEESGVFK